MREYSSVASKLKVMGHPTRLQILDMLRQGETCVCHIEQALNKRQAYISQQLMALRDAGLVASRRDGLQVYYRLIDEQIDTVLSLWYGPTDNTPQVLADCRCPHCAEVQAQMVSLSSIDVT